VHPAELDALSRSDKEAELEEWLEEKTIEEPWNISPALVNIGIGKPTLDRIASEIQETALGPILLWVATLYPVYALLYEIAEGSNRISEIVVALKNYSYLGQAPVQEVNLHDGIDNTLIILKNKLKVGINVTKEYSPDLPHVMAHGSELNQVWTNILDNAADAMNGKGEITIRTSADKMWATVEIEDNGPGIPEEIQERIFDPFFTTKEPGKGTGLGLSTSYGIITEKHKGLLDVESRPGMTKFTIKLPLNGKN
jgi:signal transduction histidine kinase